MKSVDNSRVPSTSIQLREWQEVGPETAGALVDYRLKDRQSREVAEYLTRTGQLELQELSRGLTIKTYHYVGTVQLGDLRIAVLPKITGLPLLNLLRYTYNLRNLNLFHSLQFGVEAGEFQDLLIQQLVREVAELLSRGLYRRYDQVAESLASPRGKIDFGVLSRQGGVIDASLPCNHSLRLEDNILNRALLAGMTVSTQLTRDLALRSELRKSIRVLRQSVSTVSISAELLKKANLSINRLTYAYQPALTIIQILLESLGLSIESKTHQVRSPGFLFDMNRFFQALIERFLQDNLKDFAVQEEYRLRGMMSYNPQHKPANKQPLIPRPDFAILKGKQVIALLDTKYRDLWETSLPREMLYQLAVYAFSQDRPGQAAIIYPSLNKDAREAWIDISHPVNQEFLARVILRPVNLYELERLIYQASPIERSVFAKQIAFGQRVKVS